MSNAPVQADAAAANRTPSSYYTASKFMLSGPPAGSLMEHLLQLYNAHPDICRLYNLGNSVQGRALWIMKISDNPDTEENEPEFKFSSSIHGNETPGLGSKAVGPDEQSVGFLKGFVGQDDPAKAAKLDGITGATKSSRGVKKGVEAALNVYRDVLSKGGGAQ